jgi:transcriptional regulator with XRE-family HTH domain
MPEKTKHTRAKAKTKGDVIKDFRAPANAALSVAALAAELGLTSPNMIYQWELGKADPSAETCIKLANLAAKRGFRGHAQVFVSWLGLDEVTVTSFAEAAANRLVRRTAPRDLLEVSELDHPGEVSHSFVGNKLVAHKGEPRGKGVLSFPMALIPNPASTRFVRLSNHSGVFQSGDVALIDTSQSDVTKLENGDLIAASVGLYHDLEIGVLRATVVKRADHPGVHYALRRLNPEHWHDKAVHDAFLMETITGSTQVDVDRDNRLIGTVVAWIKGEQK